MTYSLFIDEWNRPPDAWLHNWIIARCMDEAVEATLHLEPDLIVFGNSYFEKEFSEWLIEHKVSSPVEFVHGDNETYEWRNTMSVSNETRRN